MKRKFKATNHESKSRRDIKKEQFEYQQEKVIQKKERKAQEMSKKRHKWHKTDSKKKSLLVKNQIWKKFERSGIDSELDSSFFTYYKESLKDLIKDDNDWKNFAKSCCTDLKVTFRVPIKSSPVIAKYLINCIKNDFQFQGKVLVDHVDNLIQRPVITEINTFDKMFRLFKLTTNHQQLSKSELLRPLKNFMAFK